MADHRRRAASRGASPRWRWLGPMLTVGFWAGTVLFLLGTSVEQLGHALERVSSEQASFQAAYVPMVEPYLPRLVAQTILAGDVVDRLGESLQAMLAGFFQDLSTVLAIGVLVIPLQGVLYFRDKAALVERFLASVPPRFRAAVQRGLRDAIGFLNEYLSARIVESTIVGGLCCLGFYVAGVKGWLLFGVLAGGLNVVPFIGPVLSAVPPVLVTLVVDQPFVALLVVATVAVAQAVDQFYLEPFMISRRVRLGTILGVLLPLMGARLGGLMGMVFAVPFYFLHKVVLRVAYEELTAIYGKGT